MKIDLVHLFLRLQCSYKGRNVAFVSFVSELLSVKSNSGFLLVGLFNETINYHIMHGSSGVKV